VHSRPPLSRRVAALAAGLAAAAGALTGCSSGPSVTAAPGAGTAACSSLLGRLPDRVADQPRGRSPATGTAAWGDPAIVLRCGLTPSGPTTIPCLTANGVDWLFQDGDAGLTLTTFGRTPAVEVRVPAKYGRDLALAALVDLTATVSPLPVDRHCVGTQDLTG
jgi:hypothetical protein